MITGIINGHRKRLHVFMDHEEEEPIEPVPIEVVSPMLLFSQTPSEVEIQHSEDDVPKHSSQPTEQPTVQPALKSVQKSTREPRRQSVRQPAQQPVQQPALKSVRKSTQEPRRQSVRQPTQQPQDEDDDEDLELSDFEVTNEEEEDIFTKSEENVLRQAREETSKWYQSWDKASTSKERCSSNRFMTITALKRVVSRSVRLYI